MEYHQEGVEKVKQQTKEQAINASEIMQQQAEKQIGEERQKLETQRNGSDHVASSRVLGIAIGALE